MAIKKTFLAESFCGYPANAAMEHPHTEANNKVPEEKLPTKAAEAIYCHLNYRRS